MEQHLSAAMEGWRERRAQSMSVVNQVTIYEGPPSELASLVPDDVKKGKAGLGTARWELPPSKAGYWIECGYHGTDVLIARRLAAKVTSCEVVSDHRKPMNGVPLVVSIRCR